MRGLNVNIYWPVFSF